MHHTKALYYPWINFRSEEWLKNAALFWDHIQTIVPRSNELPFETPAARYFADEGIVSPFHVDPDMPLMENVAADFLDALGSRAGLAALTDNGTGGFQSLNLDKLPRSLQDIQFIAPEKLPSRMLGALSRNLDGAGRFPMEQNLAAVYMTILARNITETHHLAPITDQPLSADIHSGSKLDTNTGSLHRRHRRMRFDEDAPWGARSRVQMATSLMLEAVVESVSIDPDTPAERIVDFRRKYSDELGRFRRELHGLCQLTEDVDSLASLREQTSVAYSDHVVPAMNDLKGSLKSHHINFLSESLLKVSFFALPVTSVPLSLLGVPLTHALLAGAGVSVVASSFVYARRRADALRANPYCYLMRLREEFADE